MNLPELTPYDPADPLPGLTNRVERGVAFFDAEWPGWRDHVDPATLDLESCQRCVRGQLLHERTDHTERERIAELLREIGCGERSNSAPLDYPPSLGLESPAAYYLDLGGLAHDDYRTLTRLWREQIVREPFAGMLDAGCRYVFEGHDDGLEMWRCLTHDEVSIGCEFQCGERSQEGHAP